MTITLSDNRPCLRQWDTGRRLTITGLPEGGQIHLARKEDTDALQVAVTREGDISTALIPDELLRSPGALSVYAYVPDETGHYTRQGVKTYSIRPRPKPEDYVYTPAETALWSQHEHRLTALEQSAPSSGGGASDVWETIIDYVVPEDCANVLLTTDLNGNPFKLRRALVTVLLLPIAGVTQEHWPSYTVDGSNTYRYGMGYIPPEQGLYRLISFEVLKGPDGVHLLSTRQTRDATTYDETGEVDVSAIVGFQERFNAKTLAPVMTEISAIGISNYTTAIGKGTHIVMLGVRE